MTPPDGRTEQPEGTYRDQALPEEPPDKNEERVELRMARQKILERADPPRIWVVIDEAVGPVLTFTPTEWAAFIAGTKDGEFDL